MTRSRLLLVLAFTLLAALLVGFKRLHLESEATRVEIALDWNEFSSLARAYDYNPRALLIGLRRAGVTSLAVSEELGGAINGGDDAFVVGGATLLDQARVGGVADPRLASLLRHGKISTDAVYLTVYRPETEARYQRQLALHFDTRSIHVLHDRAPYLIEIRTQPDYFGGVALGLPEEPMRLARELHLLLIPRLQNDERFAAPAITSEFAAMRRHERVSTVIFFGLRNTVLGYPTHVDDVAAAFRASHLNFGVIETYDTSQVQKGSEELARAIPGQSVRVQAISRSELDRLDLKTVVARFLLGARERNVRVIYLRPILHQEGALSVQATNREMVRQIADGLQSRGLRLGRATPIPAFRVNPLLLAVVGIAVPTVILLILDLLGIAVALPASIAALATAPLLIGLTTLLHHTMLAAKLLGLTGAIAFAVLAVIAIAPTFTEDSPASLGATLHAGLRLVGIVTGIALAGALVVVALLSTPLTMEEIDRFSGVKAVLLVPPLLTLLAYLFTTRFGRAPLAIAEALREPVRVAQALVALLLLVGAALYLARSGNQSDIAPSTFELLLRSKLTAILSVRPRFKAFLIGIPAMMLLPSLRFELRWRIGWLFLLAIIIGAADTIDTFSHLHTPLLVSLLRVINGVVIGIIIGGGLVVALRRRTTTP